MIKQKGTKTHDLHPSRIVVTVAGGVAELHTCPNGIHVLIVDYDNLDCTSLDDIDVETSEWLQRNDQEYWNMRRNRAVAV